MAMKFAQAELREITEDTWKIFVGAELDPAPAAFKPGNIKDCIAACAQITGDWQAAIVLYCSRALARHSTATMLEREESAVGMADIHDSLCEVVNIVAGNVKGMLSGSSNLSPPDIINGEEFSLMFPHHVLLSQAAFVCRGEPLLIVLLGEDRIAAGSHRRSGFPPRAKV